MLVPPAGLGGADRNGRSLVGERLLLRLKIWAVPLISCTGYGWRLEANSSQRMVKLVPRSMKM